jgi:hypothetical protein
MSEAVALVLGMTDEGAEAGVMGTDVVGFRSGRGRAPVVNVAGFRSGRGRVSAVTVDGFRSGRGSVPVSAGALGAAAVSGAGATPDAGAAS